MADHSYPYFDFDVRIQEMDIAARITAKGQVTIPKAVRDALGIHEGDQVVFRVVGEQAGLARTADLLDLAGAVEVPVKKRGAAWDNIRTTTRKARSSR